MRQVLKFSDVDLSGANLPVTGLISAEGAALASLPGWAFLADPAHVEAGVLLNRVTGTMMSNVAGTSVALGAFDNGAPAMAFTAETIVNPNVALNPNAWSLFWVMNADATTGLAPEVARSIVNPTGVVSLRIGLNANIQSAVVYDGSTTNRLAYAPGGVSGQKMILLFTFSVTRGLTIFRNGLQVASAPSDARPLAAGFGAGEWRIFRNFRGKLGLCGALNEDIGKPEYGAQFQQMHAFLKAKYGIA